MLSIKSIVENCVGQSLTIYLNRKDALKLITTIRGIYGPSGTLVNVYHDEVTYVMFGREMPFLYELLTNEGFTTTRSDYGHIDVKDK